MSPPGGQWATDMVGNTLPRSALAPVPSCRRAHPRPLRTNAEVPSVWRGCFRGLRRHLRAASPKLDGHGRQGGGAFCGEEGWGGIPQPSLTSNVGRRTVWGGVPPEDQPLRCCGSQGGRPSIIPPACQRDASLGQRGVAFFLFSLRSSVHALTTAMPEVDLDQGTAPLFPLTTGGLEKRGRDEPGPGTPHQRC